MASIPAQKENVGNTYRPLGAGLRDNSVEKALLLPLILVVWPILLSPILVVWPRSVWPAPVIFPGPSYSWTMYLTSVTCWMITGTCIEVISTELILKSLFVKSVSMFMYSLISWCLFDETNIRCTLASLVWQPSTLLFNTFQISIWTRDIR